MCACPYLHSTLYPNCLNACLESCIPYPQYIQCLSGILFIFLQEKLGLMLGPLNPYLLGMRGVAVR